MFYLILAAALTALDQLVKFWVRANIPLGGSVPLIPHVMDLTYVQNTGAAFSLFAGHTWVLGVVSLAVSAVLAAALVKPVFRHPVGRVCLAVVLAGAVGNLIDRFALGFVTDMFRTLFIRFAVFNVADVCVVAGGVALCAYVCFFYDKLEPKQTEAAHDAPDADG